MDKIAKGFKPTKSSDYYEEISIITYLARLTEEEITTNEIEAASNVLYCALRSLHKNYYDIFENILNEEQHYIVLNESLSENSYKIFIRNTWLFRMMLLNSIKHSDIINNNRNHVNFLNSVIKHILTEIVLVKPFSLHLLRTLLLIITKRKDILTADLSLAILKQMNKVALSPITVFRQYARGISKAAIPFVPKEEIIFLDISLLPIKGMDMCDIVKRFPKSYIRENKVIIIKKVLNMLLRNVESKDGGALYESLLFYSFDEWKREIWPLFLDHLKCIDYEGEFFQSLLKYWITSNVCAYRAEFYDFLRNEHIDWKLKGYVLLESMKKGYTVNDDIMEQDIQIISDNIETRDLGLRIACTFHKKSLWPKDYQIDVVLNYLYSNTHTSLEEDEAKSFGYFLSHIFLHAHNELKKSEENLSRYISVTEKIYKYCHASLKTDFFEVSAQIIHIFWTVATGSYKNLLLNYKLEKKDCYASGENFFYKKLKENGLWLFETETFQDELVNCFNRNNGISTYLTKLFTKDLDTHLNTIDLKSILNQSVVQAGANSEKQIKNYSEIVFQNQHLRKNNLQFLEEINKFLIDLDINEAKLYSNVAIFRIVLYLEVLMTATRYNKYDKSNLHKIVEKSLFCIDNLIRRKSLFDQNYRMTKTLEAFINNVMLCMMENADILWTTINKETVINHLILIIQRSNMKRPLSLSVEVLKCFGSKMNENDLDRSYKIRFLSDTLRSLYEIRTKSDLKIRRNPESRLVIHAMCCSDESPNKPLLKWVLSHLLEVMSDPHSSDFALASTLHSMEILISDNNLQSPTLPFVSDIIIQCVELFSKCSWIVRNADLQLTRAIINRFYGVCLDVSNRPKSVGDLLVLFPNLSSYFHGILSSEKLDERAVLVFQFFIESQIKEHIFSPEVSVERFLRVFVDIVQKYPNHYGKMAARSYSALCNEKEIPKEVCSIVYFCKVNFGFLSMNILANFLFLVQLLYEKYKNSFEYCIIKDKIKVVNFAIKDLLKHLSKRDTELFNFILFKVKSRLMILDELPNNINGENLQQRLWLHNNVSFLLINSKSKKIKNVLRKILSSRLSSCIQIKVLTILISKFENKELDRETCREILGILFENCLSIEDDDQYLLNCYFKTILVFYQYDDSFNVKNHLMHIKDTQNFYKILVLIVYFARKTEQFSIVDKQNFYNLVNKMYMKFTSIGEEMKNDVISTLPFSIKLAPIELKFKLLKILFYSSLFTSTYLEAYKCISYISGNNYSNILSAVQDFFSRENLILHLTSETFVSQFFYEVYNYVPEHFQETQSDGYYSEESDILVPKLFLMKLLIKEIQNM